MTPLKRVFNSDHKLEAEIKRLVASGYQEVSAKEPSDLNAKEYYTEKIKVYASRDPLAESIECWQLVRALE